MSVKGAVLLFIIVVSCAVCVASVSSKPVHISLTSSWPRSPILLEASEFIAVQDPLLFWEFLDRTKDLASTTTDRDVYESILEHAEQLLPPLIYSCLPLSLTLHSYSPSVAMYEQLAEERQSSLGSDCIPWVEAGGSSFCTISALISSINNSQSLLPSSPEVYSFDHIYPTTSSTEQPPIAILYCQWGIELCHNWHYQMITLVSQGLIKYIFRHQLQQTSELERGTILSGYGVQLAVKNSEYKAVDDTEVKGASNVNKETEVEMDTQGFVFNTLKSLHVDLTSQLEEFRQHLEHNAREIPELKAWQLQDLGYQAAQRVASSSPDIALSIIRDLSQNLPSMARSLCRVTVKKELRSEVTSNQRKLQQYGMEPGDSVILFNGIILQTDSTDAFSVLDVLLSESWLIGGLTGLGLSLSDSYSLAQIPVHTQSQSFAVDMRTDSVIFINNLESDKNYKSWPKSLKQFLQPTFPGSLRQIARNVFNLIFCFNPASKEGMELVEYIALFLDNLVPVRFGVLLVANDEQNVGVAIARGFYYISKHHSTRKALNWLLHVQSDMSIETAAVAMETEFPDAPDDVLNETSSHELDRKEAMLFFEDKGLQSLPQVLLNGVQLDQDEDIETAIVMEIQQQTNLIQRLVYMKTISDSTDVYEYFMTRPNVLQRLNHHITRTNSLQIDFSKSLPSPIPNLDQFHSISSHSISAILAHRMAYYISAKDEFMVRPITLWLITDLESDQGRQTTISALTYLRANSGVQFGLLHNPLTSDSASVITRALLTAELNGWHSIELLLSLISSPNQSLTSIAQYGGWNETLLTEAMNDIEINDIISTHIIYCSRVLRLTSGQTAILANGRLIGPLVEDDVFTEQDYNMLVQLENSTYAHAVAETLSEMSITNIPPDDDTALFRSLLTLKVSSLLRSLPNQRRIPQPILKDKHSGVHLPAPDDALHHKIIAIINPLDPSIQKWSHILKVLQVIIPCDISIYLNPQSKLSEVPIKSFYRYVMEPELTFLANGTLAEGSLAIFSNLPHSPLLTLHMDVPHAWMVAVVYSPHDLDNIHLQSVESSVQAEFLLEHILIEGQLYDASNSQPVPGLELVLGPPSQPQLYDTVVMANLGYFQLKARPGAWRLQIREGRSKDIYTISGHSGDGLWEEEEERLSVTVRTFSGEIHIVRVDKRQGMEGARLLYNDINEEEEEEEEYQSSSVWDTLSNFMGGGNEKKESSLSNNDTINVFSIASGHLYERFLRIMMLSVIKHTKHNVKFWFLENYLSPTFKDFIPHMAAYYGFQYELVQYKWPRWLHKQTEKQRLIWGYKILFLDVLFPLSVKNIIFVDADQMVRADLAELLEVPLNGAPYGYTPFCNDRPEMEGFRFWERGYWKSHLGTRRYHISALYVVDLLRFRQLSAGDRLRGQYQALSQDPNSLSNLDQDLPNNMIHQVPIKSLPQEWLWCETWCSEASKSAAKTIDLCNNPLTKEPKLVSAMRILPEWSGLDQEIRQLQDSIGSHSDNKQTNHKHSEL